MLFRSEVVAASKDKSLELFATKVGGDRLHFDLNQCASPTHDAMTPTRNVSLDDAVELNTMSQPPFSQQIDLEMNDGDQVDEQEQYVNVDHGYGFGIDDEDREEGDMEGDVSEREDEYHDIYIGDVEAQVEEDGIDRDTFYAVAMPPTRRTRAQKKWTKMGSRREKPKPF